MYFGFWVWYSGRCYGIHTLILDIYFYFIYYHSYFDCLPPKLYFPILLGFSFSVYYLNIANFFSYRFFLQPFGLSACSITSYLACPYMFFWVRLLSTPTKSCIWLQAPFYLCLCFSLFFAELWPKSVLYSKSPFQYQYPLHGPTVSLTALVSSEVLFLLYISPFSSHLPYSSFSSPKHSSFYELLFPR